MGEEHGRSGTRREDEAVKRPIWRRLGVAVAIVLSTVVPVLSTPAPVNAAPELNAVLALPGYMRTNLLIDLAATGPADNLAFTYRHQTRELIVVDIDSVVVVVETTVPSGGRVLDLRVTADGSRLYVLTQSAVLTYDAADLSLDAEATLSPTAERRIVLATDRSDRFAVFGGGTAPIISTGGHVLSVQATGLESATTIGFGSDSDIVFAQFSNGHIARFDTSGGGVDEEFRLTDPMETEEFYERFELLGGGLVGVAAKGDRVALAAIDTSTLRHTGQDRWELDHRSPPAEGSVTLHYSGGWAATVDRTGSPKPTLSWHELDDGGNMTTSTWDMNASNMQDVLATLPGGFVIGRERAGSSGGYLVLSSSRVLASSFGDYHPLPPARVLDTRRAIGTDTARRRSPGETTTVQIAGRGGVPSTGVLAVTLNITVTEPTARGWIKVWPAGTESPVVSNVNYAAGQTVANSATVTLGEDGALDLFQFVGASSHVIFDVTGYYSDVDGAPGARYFPDMSQRLVDTRETWLGHFGRLGPGEYIDVTVPTSSGGYAYGNYDPDEPQVRDVAAVLNVTAVNGTAKSHLKVYPSDVGPSETSSVNFVPGEARPNLVVATLSSTNTVRIYNHAGEVDIVVDFFGHYIERPSGPATQNGRLYPIQPYRRFDSREWSPFPDTGQLGPGDAVIFGNGYGWTDILNVTATDTTSRGHLIVMPWQDPGPGPGGDEFRISNLNFGPGRTSANAAYGLGGPDTAIVNSAGFTHVIVDVFGYLTPPYLAPIDEYWS